MDIKSQKDNLRKILVTNVNENSDLVLSNIITFLQDYCSKKMYTISCGLYFPMKYEPDILTLSKHFDAQYSFPKIVNNVIHYAPHSTKVVQNKVFPLLLEPSGNNFCTPEIILVPGIAFDKRGYRLGLGKGHYDKYISLNPDIYRVGICFSDNLLDTLPTEPHDCKMHAIITEREILHL